MKIITILLSFLLVISCNNNQNKLQENNSQNLESIDSIRLSSTIKICDSCICNLIVYHSECTECADLYVDSGTIFLSTKVFDDYKLIIKAHESKIEKTKDTILQGNDYILCTPNFRDLYFDNKNDFYKLWPDTITFHDFYKMYKVTGIVTGFKNTYPKFRMISYKLLDKKH